MIKYILTLVGLTILTVGLIGFVYYNDNKEITYETLEIDNPMVDVSNRNLVISMDVDVDDALYIPNSLYGTITVNNDFNFLTCRTMTVVNGTGYYPIRGVDGNLGNISSNIDVIRDKETLEFTVYITNCNPDFEILIESIERIHIGELIEIQGNESYTVDLIITGDTIQTEIGVD